jgi:phosphoribosyl-AMP cyclohydrolase
LAKVSCVITTTLLRVGQNGLVTSVPTLPADVAAALKRDANGLVCAVVQEAGTGAVLMVAWMNDEALARTLATGRATYYSRSRQQLWEKGETSGHTQLVRDVSLDCDGDTLLLVVEQTGPACHTGTHTCFDGRSLWRSSTELAPEPATAPTDDEDTA